MAVGYHIEARSESERVFLYDGPVLERVRGVGAGLTPSGSAGNYAKGTRTTMALSERDTLLGIAPSLCDDVDLRTLSLTAQEGFLLSQVDGGTPAGVLSDVVAMDAAAIIAALEHLENLGVIKWAGARGVIPGLKATVPRASALAAGADPALHEECDLTADEKARILKADQVFPSLSHWEVLGLSGKPTDTDIKRAYFGASKAFHPDRYYGRDLGTYRQRLERVFRRLKIAHDVLSDKTQCEIYRVKNPPPLTVRTVIDLGPRPVGEAAPPAPAAPPPRVETPAEKTARLEKHRQEILNERRSKRWETALKPKVADLEAKHKKANEMYQFGLSQMRAGQVFAAAASFKLAMTYDPANAQYDALFSEATSRARGERSQQLAKEADAATGAGNAAKAANDYGRAFEMSPQRPDLAIRAAELFLAAGNSDSALQYATQAVAVAPNRKEAQLALAAVYEKVGDKHAALEHLRVAERLDVNDAHVRKAIKRLAK
jgi:Flp pilus assembly protein TadD